MITADTRKAVFLLHQEGTPIRQISRQLRLSRNAVRQIIAQSGQMPPSLRRPSLILDPERLRQLHQDCEGYAQRHAPKHSDRKAGEERSFFTVETNFVPGRSFPSLEDLNRQALEWSTVRMEQRPQGKAGLIPAQAFEQERAFLTPLPRHLPAPYLLLERMVDEYGYVAVEGNYYEVPGCGRGQIQVLRYLHHLVLCQDRRTLIEYALPPWGVKNQPFPAPGQKPRYRPRNRKLSSQEEEKRLRALDPVIGAYVDFILGTPGLLRHQFLRRLWTFHQRWSTALFLRTIERAHRYHITSLETLERIALLHLDDTALPDPFVDPDLEKRPAYQEGSLTETPDLSRYDE